MTPHQIAAGASAGVFTDWSFEVTYNEDDCDGALQRSGSLGRLYLKFTGTANEDSDTEEYDIYP
jgi:hypothetical protein